MTQLRLTMESQRGCTVVVAIGDLDYVTRDQFDEALTGARRQSDVVIFDMSKVDFIDTSCLSVIVVSWQALTEAGGDLLLAGARHDYARALWITGLTDLLPMFDDVRAALDAHAAKAS